MEGGWRSFLPPPTGTEPSVVFATVHPGRSSAMTPRKQPEIDRAPDDDKATDWEDSGEEGRSPEEQDRAAEGGRVQKPSDPREKP